MIVVQGTPAHLQETYESRPFRISFYYHNFGEIVRESTESEAENKNHCKKYRVSLHRIKLYSRASHDYVASIKQREFLLTWAVNIV